MNQEAQEPEKQKGKFNKLLIKIIKKWCRALVYFYKNLFLKILKGNLCIIQIIMMEKRISYVGKPDWT